MLTLAPQAPASGTELDATRLRTIVAIAGAVYLGWWFLVELLLPGAFNPLLGRLIVVGSAWALLGASYVSRSVERHLSPLFTVWVCALAAHYSYLVIGNQGESTWWVGAFVTFAAASMCLQSTLEVTVFSVVALGCAIWAAAKTAELRHSIYVPGLSTILMLAIITKRSQTAAVKATLQAGRARAESRRSDEQHLRLAAIVESSGDAIVACSLEGTIRSWNNGAERLFGYPTVEAIGQPLALLLPPGGHGEEAALIDRLRAGEPVPPFETVRRGKDGGDLAVSVTVSPIRDASGELGGVSLVARDISARRRAEAAVQRAREAAEAANQELEAFNYSVAHDLRAPLRAIDGFSLALLEDCGPALDESGQSYLRRVRTAAQQMGRLIDGLLALGRLTRASIHDQLVDLSELARGTAERLKELQPERRIEFVIANGLQEKADSALLGAVIENLLGNAWKFTRDRGDARIEFGSTREGEKTTYFVRDNGAGFDMAFGSKLFGVFQRLHAPSEFEGTGIGLATVRRIILRHGGRVWADGKVGEGATFYFTLGDRGDRLD